MISLIPVPVFGVSRVGARFRTHVLLYARRRKKRPQRHIRDVLCQETARWCRIAPRSGLGATSFTWHGAQDFINSTLIRERHQTTDKWRFGSHRKPIRISARGLRTGYLR